MSTIEDNKRIALRWFDLVTQGRVEELCAMTAPTWTMHGGPPSLPAGPDGIRALFASFGRIEQTWSIKDVIAEGDKVAVRAWNDRDGTSYRRSSSSARRRGLSFWSDEGGRVWSPLEAALGCDAARLSWAGSNNACRCSRTQATPSSRSATPRKARP
jgi:ketosteroid isomerase-like protein